MQVIFVSAYRRQTIIFADFQSSEMGYLKYFQQSVHVCLLNSNVRQQTVQDQNMTDFKRPITDFIRRVMEMIEKYPQTIGWSPHGAELVIYNEKRLRKHVLPQFFRHDRTGSFIRQLNIYGFHKICCNKFSINFRHENFRRGNQSNFNQIQRKKKEKADSKAEVKSMEDSVKQEIHVKYSKRLPSLPIVTQSLLIYKNNACLNLRQLKKRIQLLGREVNPRRSKKVKPLITSIKQILIFHEEKVAELERKIIQCFRRGNQPQDNEYSSPSLNQPEKQVNTPSSRQIAMEQEIDCGSPILIEGNREESHALQIIQFGSISKFFC